MLRGLAAMIVVLCHVNGAIHERFSDASLVPRGRATLAATDAGQRSLKRPVEGWDMEGFREGEGLALDPRLTGVWIYQHLVMCSKGVPGLWGEP